MTNVVPSALRRSVISPVQPASKARLVTRLRVAVKDVAEPAKSAGIQKHDVLLAIEDTDILNGAQLKNYLIEHTIPGQRVSVKVRRIDADLTFHVVLGGG